MTASLLWVVLSLLHPDPAAQAQAVEKALVVAEPRLHRCWEIAAADDYRVEGRIDLRVTIGDRGRARKVQLLADSTGKKPLGDCVEKAFGDASFGDAFADGDQVEVPVTFKAEANVTVRAADATAYPLKGARGVAKVLIDPKSAAADKASLVWLDVEPGSTFVRPTPKGMAFVFVLKGRAKFGKVAATAHEVVVLDDGAAPAIKPSMTTQMLVLFVPAGAEQSYRSGAHVPAPSDGPEPRLVKQNAAPRFDILGGKGSARIYIENDKAAVEHLTFEAGAVVPEHRHDGSAEILFLNEGKGELTVEGEKFPVGPTTAVYIPAGARHSLTVTEAVDAIQFYTPSGPEQRFKGAR
jgi:quercetin dioxygenase-like cupin family protein